MKKYDKLVRDKIPDIIEQDRRKAVYHVLSDQNYITELDKKLREEVNEYIEDKSLEELADILEVIFAICKARGHTIDLLEDRRREKAEERGGFEAKLFLEYVD